jgi:gluconolactonase
MSSALAEGPGALLLSLRCRKQAVRKGCAPMDPEGDSTPGIEAVAPWFAEVARPDAEVRLVADGFQFTEGPVWIDPGNGPCLLFSDIPGDTIYRWTESEGHGVWRKPSHNANGNTVDLEGRLVTCEHGSRTVTRTGRDGSVATLASSFDGKRLNSPNDVVVKRDGTIWFTDPPYGIKPEEIEQPASYVFRLDPGAEEPVPVADDFSRPNGLCFSPDEKLLYVDDSDTEIHHIRRFRVHEDNTLEGGEVFVTVTPGVPDGMRVDEAGRLYSTAGDGIHVFMPDGRLLGKIRTPETAANCTFGGPERTTLFITAVSSVWAVDLPARGA